MTYDAQQIAGVFGRSAATYDVERAALPTPAGIPMPQTAAFAVAEKRPG